MSQSNSSRSSGPPPPGPSDLQPAKGFASSLTGNLPTGKRRRSPFDRLGARQWQPQKGQKSESYA